MTNPAKRYRNRAIPTDEEIQKTLKKAEKIPFEYFRLRVKALIGLVKKFGKRRAEVGTLALNDLEEKEGFLYVTFTLRKKHKKGLFQYIRYLKRLNDSSYLNKSYSQLQDEWRSWTDTANGHTIKE